MWRRTEAHRRSRKADGVQAVGRRIKDFTMTQRYKSIAELIACRINDSIELIHVPESNAA